MKSNYALYIKEREGFDIIENEKGFLTYFHDEPLNSLFLGDIFIKKEFRKKGIATEFVNSAEKIAKEKNCLSLTGRIHPPVPNSTASMKLFLKLGFELSTIAGGLIYIVKKVGE